MRPPGRVLEWPWARVLAMAPRWLCTGRVRCFEGSSLRVAASSSCSSKEHARTCTLEGAVMVGAGKAGHSAVLLLLSAEALRSRVRSSCESCSASRFLSASDGTPPRAIRAAQAIEARGSAGCRFTRSGSSAFRALPRTSTSTRRQAERSIDPGVRTGSTVVVVVVAVPDSLG